MREILFSKFRINFFVTILDIKYLDVHLKIKVNFCNNKIEIKVTFF